MDLGCDLSTPNERTCAIIVTFNPSDKVIDTIMGNFHYLDNVLIYDNGSTAEIKSKLKTLLKERENDPNANAQGIYFINGSENAGLPKAYNNSIKFLKGMNYDYVLILDQDSKLSQGTVGKLFTQYERLSQSHKVGAVSPIVIQEGQGPLNIFFDGRFRWRGFSYEDEFVFETPFLINSGTFIHINILEEIGYYDESLFLDSVDHDMSFRMRAYGYHLFIVKDIVLSQNIDNKIDFKFLWIRLDREGHSPTNDYYMVRDSMRVAQRYIKNYWPQCLLLYLNVIIKFVATIFIYRHKSDRFTMIIKGFKDFILSL